MRRPAALDLFCGGGGAALGMLDAGFRTVLGVDLVDCSAAYPGVFVRGDGTVPPVRVEDFDFVWASPPCQGFSRARAAREGGGEKRAEGVELLAATRAVVTRARRSCIENVPEAGLRNPIRMTGLSVGLPQLYRLRHFEVRGFFCAQPWASRPEVGVVTVTTHHPAKELQIEAMGLPQNTRMTQRQIGNAVPPGYAEHIARWALRDMARRAESVTVRG